MVEIGATGEGVRVALIDSGINAGHPHVGGVAGGVGLHRTADAIKEQPEFSDVNGHGTACAGVVRWMAASADIFSVRVLGPDLLCDGELLARALDWCLKSKMEVINISAGSTERGTREMLREPLMALEEMGVVVVAAAQEPGEGAWPAGSPTVLSVGSHPNAAPRQLYRDSTGARLFAAGHPRMAEGAPGGANFSGASFAAPRVAAMAACLKQSHPTLSAAALRARIMDLAVERPS